MCHNVYHNKPSRRGAGQLVKQKGTEDSFCQDFSVFLFSAENLLTFSQISYEVIVSSNRLKFYQGRQPSVTTTRMCNILLVSGTIANNFYALKKCFLRSVSPALESFRTFSSIFFYPIALRVFCLVCFKPPHRFSN